MDYQQQQAYCGSGTDAILCITSQCTTKMILKLFKVKLLHNVTLRLELKPARDNWHMCGSELYRELLVSWPHARPPETLRAAVEGSGN